MSGLLEVTVKVWASVAPLFASKGTVVTLKRGHGDLRESIAERLSVTGGFRERRSPADMTVRRSGFMLPALMAWSFAAALVNYGPT